MGPGEIIFLTFLIILFAIVIYLSLFHKQNLYPPLVLPKKLGEACTYDADCDTGAFCAHVNPQSPIGTCQAYCASNSTCSTIIGTCAAGSDEISSICTLTPCQSNSDCSGTGTCVNGKCYYGTNANPAPCSSTTSSCFGNSNIPCQAKNNAFFCSYPSS